MTGAGKAAPQAQIGRSSTSPGLGFASGLSQRSARIASMNSPPAIPASIPVATYASAKGHPSRLPSMITAISLIIGEVMRNDMVMPKGIFAVVNPTNRGMLEQEQNGVTAPNAAPRA